MAVSIGMIKVRARITIGTGITAVTPSMAGSNYILSFNVDKARGQISTFSASLKVRLTQATTIAGATIKIEAGEGSPQHTIFNGIVKKITISPCNDDPNYVIMNISGADVLSKLEGKRYTRRCRSRKGLWVGIEGIARPGLRSSKLAYTPAEKTIQTWGGDVERKNNVVQTRAINMPEKVASPPKGDIEQEVPLAVEYYQLPGTA